MTAFGGNGGAAVSAGSGGVSLKERFEALRGEPIVECATRPEDFPCQETSDSARLVRHPLVSVVMITYNHEKFIRRAIEGVVGQEADFDYELLVGEDCSTDGTRRICMECQKDHPDRVRVLWSDENLYRLGGNGARTLVRCRGEFIAFCEGDDYWTNPRKLQRQIDLLRKHSSAGCCFGGADFLEENTGEVRPFDPSRSPEEFMEGLGFCRRMLARSGKASIYLQSHHTSTFVVRRSVFEAAWRKYADLFSWRLRFADFSWFMSSASLADVCFLSEAVSVYRMNDGGATRRDGARMMLDGDIGKIYFGMAVFDRSFEEMCGFYADGLVIHWTKVALSESVEGQRGLARRIASEPTLARAFMRPHCRLIFRAIAAGALTRRKYKWLRLIYGIGAHLAKTKEEKAW